jgi:DNA repair ATPase RecN
MESNEKLADLHSEHALWQNRIIQFKDQIKEMNDRLGAILSKLTPHDVPPLAEHFQNQFILQRDVLDIMRHDFKQYENLIENEQKVKDQASAALSQMRHAYNTRIEDFERIFKELNMEFQVFVKEEFVSA